MEDRNPQDNAAELRLFIGEIACTICRHLHAARDGVRPEEVRIDAEVPVGAAQGFADIVVDVPGRERYIVEIDYAYPSDRLLASIGRKYSRAAGWLSSVSRLVVVVDRAKHEGLDELAGRIRQVVPSSWTVELWDEARLVEMAREQIGAELPPLAAEKIQDVRHKVDQAQGHHAFGAEYAASALDAILLWHFGHWRLRGLHEAASRDKRRILPPQTYADVAVVFADLSGFSGYVRDTPHDQTIRDCLGFFCALSRQQILEAGGMTYQYLGDAVIGCFGLPDRPAGYIDRAFECARSLLRISEAVSLKWQCRLDRVQPVHGGHIGIALGDLQLFPLRPFSRTHFGAVGDAVNLAARLSAHAEPGQIVVSNLVHRGLSLGHQQALRESEPVQAKNVGLIRAWVAGP